MTEMRKTLPAALEAIEPFLMEFRALCGILQKASRPVHRGIAAARGVDQRGGARQQEQPGKAGAVCGAVERPPPADRRGR